MSAEKVPALPRLRRGAVPQGGAIGMLAVIGAATGTGALAASSCCVLPLLLGGLGAGAGVFAVLEALAPLRMPLLAVSTLVIVAAWWCIVRSKWAACPSEADCTTARRSRATVALLGVATVLVTVGAAWGSLEPILLKLLRAT